MYRYILAAILASIVGIVGGIQGNAGTVYLLAGLLLFNIVNQYLIRDSPNRYRFNYFIIF